MPTVHNFILDMRLVIVLILNFFLSAEDDVSSVAANIEQLNIQRDDQGTAQEDDNPSVVIPNHLQLHTPECMNLSFGSFGSANPLSGSGSFTSRSLKGNLEDTSGAVDASTIENSDTRCAAYIIVYFVQTCNIMIIPSFLKDIFLAEILTIMGMSILLLLPQMEI